MPKTHRFELVEGTWFNIGELANALGILPSQVLKGAVFGSTDVLVETTEGREVHMLSFKELLDAIENFEKHQEGDLIMAGALFIPYVMGYKVHDREILKRDIREWAGYQPRESVVMPATYSFKHSPWLWCQAKDVAQILGVRVSELIDRFGVLSKDVGFLAVTEGRETYNVDLELLQSVVVELEEAGMSSVVGAFFVPRGWAEDVLKVFRKGYNRVNLVEMVLDEKDLKDWQPHWLAYHTTSVGGFYHVAVGVC